MRQIPLPHPVFELKLFHKYHVYAGSNLRDIMRYHNPIMAIFPNRTITERYLYPKARKLVEVSQVHIGVNRVIRGQNMPLLGTTIN